MVRSPRETITTGLTATTTPPPTTMSSVVDAPANVVLVQLEFMVPAVDRLSLHDFIGGGGRLNSSSTSAHRTNRGGGGGDDDDDDETLLSNSNHSCGSNYSSQYSVYRPSSSSSKSKLASGRLDRADSSSSSSSSLQPHTSTDTSTTSTPDHCCSLEPPPLQRSISGFTVSTSSSVHQRTSSSSTTTKPHQATFVRFASDEKGRLLTEVWKFPKYSPRELKSIWYRGRDFKSFGRRAQTKAAKCGIDYLKGLEELRRLCGQKADTMKRNGRIITDFCHVVAKSPYRGLEPFVPGTAERRKRVIQSILDEQAQWLALGGILTDEERMVALGEHCRSLTKSHRRVAHLLATGDALLLQQQQRQRQRPYWSMLSGNGDNPSEGGGVDRDLNDDNDVDTNVNNDPSNSVYLMDPDDYGQLEI